MAKLRLLGDLHGNKKRYLELISECDYSIQVGDLDFEYSYLNLVDSSKHIIIPGNHDNYDELVKYPHFRTGFGMLKIGSFEAFYMRGAYSIDAFQRTPHVDYWPNEELTFEELYGAYQQYIKLKPKILIAHELPTEGIEVLGLRGLQLNPPFKIKSTTQQTLQMMVEAHRPERVIGGHWHCDGSRKRDGCKFTCIGIDCYRDFEV